MYGQQGQENGQKQRQEHDMVKDKDTQGQGNEYEHGKGCRREKSNYSTKRYIMWQ
jgi:hypothetical protein